MKQIIIFFFVFLISGKAYSQQLGPEFKCVTEEQFKSIAKAIKELDSIHRSHSLVYLRDPIYVVQDWDGRIYVNGGVKKPLHAIIEIGPTIKREVEITIETKVYKRERPEDPMFRLRYRAHVLSLPVELIRTKSVQNSSDIGLGLDFFHTGDFNLSVHGGIRSSGISMGYDITPNFGAQVSAGVVYERLVIGPGAGFYFSFN